MLLEEGEEQLAHFRKAITVTRRGITEESVPRAFFRGRFATCFLRLILCPKILSTLWAEFSHESLLFEKGKRVLFSWEPFQVSGHPVLTNLMRVYGFHGFKQFRYPILNPSKKPRAKLPMKGRTEINPTSHDAACPAPPSPLAIVVQSES